MVWWLAVSALLPAAMFAQSGERSSGKPNVIFILADDLGWADLGSYGQQKIRTPHLDRMAAEGIRFTNFYAGSPVCAPSRAVLMTGKHGGHAYIRDNREVRPEGQWPIPAVEVTVAELLRSRGYATGAFGKWGLGFVGTEGDPNKQGFDRFFGYNCQREAHNFFPDHLWRNSERVTLEGNARGLTGRHYSHDLIEAEALQFIRDHRNRPFFLYLPFTIPHVALQVPEDSLAEYVGQWDDPAYDGKKGYLPHPHPRAAYAAMVTRMDRSVGRLLALIRELGLDENTIVFFTSDNGPAHGGVGGSDSAFFESAGPFRGLKGSVYEGGIRVPLIARWPSRIKAGAVSDLPAAFYDVLPTLCEVAGAPMPKNTDGLSILPTLVGAGRQQRHQFLFWDFNGYGGQQAVRLGGWKGVRVNLQRGETKIELYNLANDPGEQHDLAPKNPELVQRIAAIMEREHTRSEVFPMKFIDHPKPQSLQPRGYSIPFLDLSGEKARQVIVDREPGQYLGHPTTVLLEDHQTIIAVYPKGHGRGAIIMKRSTDGGRTWSARLPTPKSWETSLETPTIHRVIDATGRKRLILFSGLYPIRMSVSEDDGRTWSELKPIGDFGGIVAMGFVEPLQTGRGHYLAMFHDDGRFFTNDGKRSEAMTLYQTISTDGGLTWSAPREIFKSDQIHLCEPGLIRSPDGKQLAVLLRENKRARNSHVIFSNDEARSWTPPRELAGALTGDRHTGKYAPDGRLFISFRDMARESPTRGDWVAWVGTYEDIANGREGQYRVRLMDNFKNSQGWDADCAYPGVEVMPDGTFVTTTYGHWAEGEPPYIISVRLTLKEIDLRVRTRKQL
jgi:arylsulfatase